MKYYYYSYVPNVCAPAIIYEGYVWYMCHIYFCEFYKFCALQGQCYKEKFFGFFGFVGLKHKTNIKI